MSDHKVYRVTWVGRYSGKAITRTFKTRWAERDSAKLFREMLDYSLYIVRGTVTGDGFFELFTPVEERVQNIMTLAYKSGMRRF